MTNRTDAQKLADAIGRVREIGRFQDGDDREPVVVYTSHGDTGLRYIVRQENEESLVLTPRELRWLVGVMFGDPDPIPAWRFWLGNLRWRIASWAGRRGGPAASPRLPEPWPLGRSSVAERSERAAAAALWIAAIDVKPIEERIAAVARWMRQAEEAGLFRASGPEVSDGD